MVTDPPPPRVALAVPDGWEELDEPGALLSVRPAGAGPGAPSVSVVVVDSPAPDADAHLLEALGQLSAVLSDLHLVAASTAPATATGPATVDLVVAHEVLGVDLTTVQHRVLAPDRPGPVVVVAASVADVLWAAWRPGIERLLGTLEVAW